MQMLKRAAMTRELIPARKPPIVVNDSAKTGFKSMNMYGWCKQKQYEGTNLFDLNNASKNTDKEEIKSITTISNDGYVIEVDINILQASDPNDETTLYKRYDGIVYEFPDPASYIGKTLRIDVDSWETTVPGESKLVNFRYRVNSGDLSYIFPESNENQKSLTWTVPEGITTLSIRLSTIESSEKTVPVGKYKVRIEGARLTIGEDMKPWEPYTGGNPSPNPDYPQKIEVAGLNEGVKNLWRNDSLVSVVGTGTITLAKTIPAGQYTISAVVTSNDTDDDYCAMLAYYTDGTTKEIGISRSKNEYERKSTTVTFDKTVNKIRFYASSGHSTSTGDTATFDEIQIEDGSVATDYTPYTGENEIRVEVSDIGINLLTNTGEDKNYQGSNRNWRYISQNYATVQVTGNEAYVTYDGEGGNENTGLNIRPNDLYFKRGETYTFSIDAKGYTQNEPFIKIFYEVLSGEWWNQAQIKYIELTESYQRYFIQFTIPDDAADQPIINISVSFGEDTSAWLYAKNPKLERGAINNPQWAPSPSDEGYDLNYGSLTIPTPNGLPGVPIYGDTLPAIYTDTDGQGWWCDEIDFTNGEYVKRVEHAIFDGSEDEYWHFESEKSRYLVPVIYNPDDYLDRVRHKVICNFGSWRGINGDETGQAFSYYNNIYVYPDIEKYPDVDSWKAFLSEHQMEIYYPLKNPVRTPLTTELLAQYAELTAYTPTTTISNSADCYMRVGYLTMEEFVPSDNPSAYPISEIGKYYKALAGFDVELPEPSCRETMMVRKLFDPGYEVEFGNYADSWTEKYLIDLINKTNTCFTHNPESDTEKYLAYMLGRRDIQMPVEDCERNFWMARAAGIPIGGAE